MKAIVKKSNCGQVVIEYMILIPLFVTAITSFGGIIAFLLARDFLYIDLFYLARAHRYDNKTHYCQLSPHWPQFLEKKIICHPNGQINASITAFSKFSISESVDLQT